MRDLRHCLSWQNNIGTSRQCRRDVDVACRMVSAACPRFMPPRMKHIYEFLANGEGVDKA